MPDDTLPRRFGPYLLFDQIGEGGMARLYLGKNTTNLGGERLVVVKQVLPMLTNSDEFCRLLTQEAKLAAQLSHRNIAQVVDLGREGDVLYIAMEYVEGFDLRDLLRECSRKRLPLPVQYALLIVLETLRGLDYAHKKQDDAGQALGIVHRDVSPSNVLISFDGDVKLCDFGIALAFGAKTDIPEAGVQGKAGYMSPEAAAGKRIDERSDVFAVGIILWELLNGRRLYRGENRQPPTLEIAAEASIPPLKQRGYPHEQRLHAIVMRALTKDPDQRYPSAGEMRADLERYTRESSLFASPIKFGQWLTDNFADEILQVRRAREHSAKAVEPGLAPPPSQTDGPHEATQAPAGTSVETPDMQTGITTPDRAHRGPAATTSGVALEQQPLEQQPMVSKTPPPVTTNLAPSGKAVEIARGEPESEVFVATGELGALSSRPPKALWAAAAVLVMVVLIVLLTL